jgi:hypothetical protein
MQAFNLIIRQIFNSMTTPLKRLLFIPLVFASLIVFGDEKPWPVPEDQASVTAPEMFTNEMVKMGEEAYLKNCKSCHGDIGKNNMIQLNPLPKDLSTVGAQSDGSFYYKIKEGRGTMPTFKNTLSVAEKWNIIAYIRSFDKNYVQPQPNVGATFGGSAVKLALEYLAVAKQFRVIAMGKDNDKDVPAEGVEIALFAERYFGNLKLADSKTTNKDGIVLFDAPDNLPGDKEGVLKVLAKVTDTDTFGEASAKAEIKAGIPSNKPSLTEQRALWNVVSKAPWWITIAYPLAVLAAFGTIGYILLLLKKIYGLGKEETVDKI